MLIDATKHTNPQSLSVYCLVHNLKRATLFENKFKIHLNSNSCIYIEILPPNRNSHWMHPPFDIEPDKRET